MNIAASQNSRAGEAREFAFTAEDFAKIAAHVHTHLGIQLQEQKRDMVYGRLVRRLRALNLPSFADYLQLLAEDPDSEMEHLANAITTNVTSFFREPHHFDHLANTVLPFLMEQNAHTRSMRFWSAGCSMGMEAYSMALTLAPHLRALSGWDIKILATDIDTNVLNKGRAGEYDAKQWEKIPTPLRRGNVELDEAAGVIRIAPHVRELVHFKPLNLLSDWPMRKPFDVIFCRNVVIYFDKPTQRILFERYADSLRPNGWLYIGHSENLFHVCDRFKLVGNTIYERVR